MDKTKKNDKRERLILAADKLIYEHTFHTTTLADIAKEADVPLGNVYYYFKTKETIIIAVIQRRSQELQDQFALWEQSTDIKDRFKNLVEFFAARQENLAHFGCPIGSLCQELGKQGGSIADSASKLLDDIIKWCQKQFNQAGKTDAQALAEQMVSLLQGMSLMTLTFKDPSFITRQTNQIYKWLDNELSSTATSSVSSAY